jgi:hypothetical protein
VGKTRADVKAELADAMRQGDLVANGETGATFKPLNPSWYAQPVLAQGKTREIVRAELVKSRASNGGQNPGAGCLPGMRVQNLHALIG